MSLTKALNSKSNIKQFSQADLPVQPRQPVIARYAAESTANQTIINLPFSIDTATNPDVLMVSVDGKLLTPGATNDFVFSGVDAFGFSNTLTLNAPITAGLNIQAIKLGLKKETEFLQDQRFNDVYETQAQALQGFVRTADLMTATTTPGAPANGTFYSTIINRASIVDQTKDLKPRMGIERIITQSIYQLQNEFGPNGEPVWATLNDTLGQIRLVGECDANINVVGNYIRVGTVSADTTSFLEITFYGTALNVLTLMPGAVTTAVASVDGGAEGSNFVPNQSTILGSRNYSGNIVVPVVSGLSQGVHTVKIRKTGTTAFHFHGFEIINESSSIKVQPGTSYIGGKKLSSVAQQTLSYNSGFESGSLGTRGGRVLVYQKADGSIASAVQPVDTTQKNLAAADHSNEEIIRVYSPREFGAGRSDDFSLATGGPLPRAFTLDDGTTTLTSNAATYTSTQNNMEALGPNTTSDFISFTFVGTGLDILCNTWASGVLDSSDIRIDGVSVGNLSPVNGLKNLKVVSGLPYGTHTVKMTRNAIAGYGLYFSRLTVYGPKKPTVPAGAIELADYNVMADYVASTTSATANGPLSTGGISKTPMREVTYVGTWSVTLDTINMLKGFYVSTATANDYFEYSFFGTGIELYSSFSVSTVSATIQIDGANYTGAAVASNTSTWTPGTSTWFLQGSGGCQLRITGLSLGLHKVRLTRVSGGTILFAGLNIITPIHSAKSNNPFDIQNTLPVGSNAISDNRKTSAIKDVNLQKKNIVQALGITSSPTMASTAPVPMPDMSVVSTNTSGKVKITTAFVFSNVTSAAPVLHIFIDGVQAFKIQTYGVANQTGFSYIANVSPGIHKIDIYWSTTSGTVTAHQTDRILIVEEI